MTNRDNSIDILRSIALIGMIISHCEPHWIIMQFREYDVSLIVFLSGVSYMLSAKRYGGEVQYLPYCWKRFKRLVFPTWVFLLIYYAVLYTGTSITGNLNVKWVEILHNFTLTTGWYVWIIRVFLIIALVAPFLYKLSIRTSNRYFWWLFTGVLIAYEFVAKLSRCDAYYYLTMCIPYMMIFSYGAISDRMSKRNLLIVAIVSFVIFVLAAIYYYVVTGAFQPTQIRKYPPQLYYTSYAIAVTTILWMYRKGITQLCDSLRISNLFSFIGSHTLWIYFWHVIVLLVIGARISNPVLLFVTVFLIAVIIDYLQVRIIEFIFSKVNNEKVKNNLSIIFLG